MANEPSLDNHEDRIIGLETRTTNVENRTVSIEDDVRVIHEDLRERYARIDENNKNLRELAQSQIIQNTKILDSVLTGRQEAAKREGELKSLTIKTRAELWLKAIGSGGIFYLVVDILLKIVK